MSRPFLGRSAIVDIIKSRERTNAIQKREGLQAHPVTFTVCGCSDEGCGGFHTIRTQRTVPTADDCAAIIAADNAKRKRPPSSKP